MGKWKISPTMYLVLRAVAFIVIVGGVIWLRITFDKWYINWLRGD